MIMRTLAVIAIVLTALSQQATAKPVIVASFNLANLFDTKDDADNPHDDTYLPLSVKQADPDHNRKCNDLYEVASYRQECKTLDWSEAAYAAKLKNIADVILAMPELPDVLIVQEVENRLVLEELVSRHLADKGYEIIQLDTSDKPISRGIDAGVLSRLKIAGSPMAHKVDFGNDAKTCGATRDIVQADLELPDGTPLTLFGVHFPSGGNPIECRIHAFKTLRAASSRVPEGRLVLAGGDFNFNCNEQASPAFDRLLFRGNWYAPPAIRNNCAVAGSEKFIDFLNDSWNSWSFLDMILVRKELSPTQPSALNWFADLGSFSTLAVHPSQIAVDKHNEGYVEPREFDPKTLQGVSDHWPVMMRFVQRR